MTFSYLLLAVVTSTISITAVAQTRSYDVVIVGGGASGISAAIQAARLGQKVAVLEETDWIGGQMTAAGVTSMDGGSEQTQSSIYREFAERITSHYRRLGKSTSTCYWQDSGGICFEPHVGLKVLNDMINSARLAAYPRGGIDLVLRRTLHPQKGVIMRDSTLAAVITQRGEVYYAKKFIDATEHGDLLALTPAGYRLGNSRNSQLNPSACIQDITYTVVLRKYSGGVPLNLRFHKPPPGYTPEVRARFASYISRENGGDAARPFPWTWAFHNGYRGMPDSKGMGSYTAGIAGAEFRKITKTGVNLANDYPYTVQNVMDRDSRRAAHCGAKLLTLQFMYYVQADPEGLRETSWGISTDEGYNTPYNQAENLCPNIPQELKEIEKNFPVMPYVREGRRLIGDYTLTGKDLWRGDQNIRALKRFPSAVAMGDYPVDLHNCSHDAALEADLGEVHADIPPNFVGGAFQIPMEVFFARGVEGLLVAEKNISVSRLGNGSIRLQPSAMSIGQTAGMIASLANLLRERPQDLNPNQVQAQILATGSPISLLEFHDVPRNHPFWQATQFSSTHGFMVGYGGGIFGVNDFLSRGQMSAVLINGTGLSIAPPPTIATFADVPATHLYSQAVEEIYRRGITSGCGTSPMRFCPDAITTRGQIAVFIIRALGVTPTPVSSTPYFADVPITHPFFSFIQKGYELGLLSSCGANLFCPDSSLARGEAARILMMSRLKFNVATGKP